MLKNICEHCIITVFIQRTICRPLPGQNKQGGNHGRNRRNRIVNKLQKSSQNIEFADGQCVVLESWEPTCFSGDDIWKNPDENWKEKFIADANKYLPDMLKTQSEEFEGIKLLCRERGCPHPYLKS